MGNEGNPKLIWSPIQLRLENEHNVVSTGRMTGVNVCIDGVRNITNFEVINIVGNRNTYPMLLGLK